MDIGTLLQSLMLTSFRPLLLKFSLLGITLGSRRCLGIREFLFLSKVGEVLVLGLGFGCGTMVQVAVEARKLEKDCLPTPKA